jgi:4Fe-4S ferredoxin
MPDDNRALATCGADAGRVRPVIDRSRCEAKSDCVRVCPYGVFEVRKLDDAERGALPWLSRVKVLVHGGKQAFAVRAGDCHACGLCVKACPESAITLVPVTDVR